ncbi:MAG: hypothetical protein RLZZ511_4342 [Cyanobacteriota bacterium]
MLKKIVGLAICAIVLVGCVEVHPKSDAPVVRETVSAVKPLPIASPVAAAEGGTGAESEPVTSRPSQVDGRRQKVMASLQQVQQQSELLTKQMSGRQETINQLSAEANDLERDLAAFKGKVQAYILEHKMEVACMGALGMSLDEGNQFSKDAKDAKDAAALVTLGCGMAVLSNGEFAGSVAKVFDQLVQAGSKGNEMMQRLQGVQASLAAEQGKLEQEQAKADALVTEIKEYQSQLDT